MWEITKQNLGDKFGESLWLKVYCDTPMCFSVCVCVCVFWAFIFGYFRCFSVWVEYASYSLSLC